MPVFVGIARSFVLFYAVKSGLNEVELKEKVLSSILWITQSKPSCHKHHFVLNKMMNLINSWPCKMSFQDAENFKKL